MSRQNKSLNPTPPAKKTSETIQTQSDNLLLPDAEADLLVLGESFSKKTKPGTPLTPANILSLQRTIGNQAVLRILAKRRKPITQAPLAQPTIQRTLRGNKRTVKNAEEEHLEDRRDLIKIIEEGLNSPDERLRNSCEWVKKRTSGTLLYALTPTDDSDERAKASGHQTEKGDPSRITYFKSEPIYGEKGSHKYKPSKFYDVIENTGNLETDKQNRKVGSTEANGISFGSLGLDGYSETDTGAIHILGLTHFHRGRENVWKILKHEIQHVADNHKNTLPDFTLSPFKSVQPPQPPKSGEKTFQDTLREDQKKGFESYVTELRAFSFESEENSNYSVPIKSPINKSTMPGYVTPKSFPDESLVTNQQIYTWRLAQWQIIKKLFSSESYFYFCKAWQDDDEFNPPDQREFQKAVVNFKVPLSINPKNSPRVQLFFQAVKAFEGPYKAEMKKEEGNVTELQAYTNLEKVAKDLKPEERHEILNNSEMKRVLSKMLQTELDADPNDVMGYETVIKGILLQEGEALNPNYNPYREAHGTSVIDYNPPEPPFPQAPAPASVPFPKEVLSVPAASSSSSSSFSSSIPKQGSSAPAATASASSSLSKKVSSGDSPAITKFKQWVNETNPATRKETILNIITRFPPADKQAILQNKELLKILKGKLSDPKVKEEALFDTVITTLGGDPSNYKSI